MKTTRLGGLSIPVDLYECEHPEALLIQPLERKETATIGHELSLISRHTGRPFAMAAFKIEDWHLQLTPWHDDAISRREEVGAHAEETLLFITDELLPRVESQLGNLPVVLGGYSRAGLFALWASTRTDRFDAVAAASPSVWIRDWQAYASCHPTRAHLVYMSLGRKEEQVRNTSMARVGDNIRFEQYLLEQQLGSNRTTLQWNEGGHFVEMDSRTAFAYAWTLNRLHALRKATGPEKSERQLRDAFK